MLLRPVFFQMASRYSSSSLKRSSAVLSHYKQQSNGHVREKYRSRYYSQDKEHNGNTFSRSDSRKEPTREKYERREYSNSDRSSSRSKKRDEDGARSKKSLKQTISEMIETERHHIIQIHEDSSGEIKEVVWCPKYVEEGRNIRGGKATLHHMCRSCRRLCLHLLGKPFTSNRKCLNCHEDGWKSERIPKWYYHERCRHCK